MGWRIVYIDTNSKVTYKNDYLVIKSEGIKMIHISEIDVLIIASTQVLISSWALCECNKRKIKIIFCDERRNPYGEIIPFFGSSNAYRKYGYQINWTNEVKQEVTTQILKQKIENQATLLKKIGKKREFNLLVKYAKEMEIGDSTNREGHAAKVYFGALFGKGFTREIYSEINTKLNYGYSILLSYINREIVAGGYLTMIGINHHNEYNPYNLSCDLIEPFRVLVDELTFNNISVPFDAEMKIKLVRLLEKEVEYEKKYYLSDAISLYVNNVLNSLTNNDTSKLKIFKYL